MDELKDLITLPVAAKLLPIINGRTISPTTMWRWARYGFQGVKLQTRAVGRRLCTTAQWLYDFTLALSELPPRWRSKRLGSYERQAYRGVPRCKICGEVLDGSSVEMGICDDEACLEEAERDGSLLTAP